MLITYKATARKLAEGLMVETASRGFKILMDEPENAGGTNASLNPVEAILCALGACQTIVAYSFAKLQNFTFDEFYVDLEGDLDTDGYMGKTDVRSGFQEIRFVMHFKTKEPREKVEAFSEFIERTCPVGDSLAYGVKLVKAGVQIER